MITASIGSSHLLWGEGPGWREGTLLKFVSPAWCSIQFPSVKRFILAAGETGVCEAERDQCVNTPKVTHGTGPTNMC